MPKKRKDKADTVSAEVEMMRANMPQPPPHITILPEITGRSLDFSKILAQEDKTIPATATTVEPKKIPAKAIAKPKRTTTKTKKETETK